MNLFWFLKPGTVSRKISYRHFHSHVGINVCPHLYIYMLVQPVVRLSTHFCQRTNRAVEANFCVHRVEGKKEKKRGKKERIEE